MSDQVQVRVRMYRQGFGDCFLLTFSPKGKPAEVLAHVLVDCGVDSTTKNGSELIRDVADNILETTGKTLDLLIVTHEHWDHVSGFLRAQGAFDELRIERVWLAWTEDPTDQFARSLKVEKQLAVSAAAFAARRLRQNGALAPTDRVSLERVAEGAAGVLAFFGEAPLEAAKFSKETDKAMDYVSGRKTDGSFCQPGMPALTLQSVPGARFYVLGPPRDKKRLKRMNPSSVNPETYELGPSSGANLAFAAAVQDTGSRGGLMSAPELLSATEARRFRGYPFPEPAQIPESSPMARGMFGRSYFGDGREWRRIDYDWLTGATDLALQVDNAINNTSLAFAIELPETRRVLLFPADAQVGNWVSWALHSWMVTEATGEKRWVSAEDLLRRTVLYKVGHHGSHNATLKEQGLELMVSRDLVAMMPVDEAFAHSRHGWPIPHPPLRNRLIEKTRGRLLRIDKDWPAPDSEKPPNLTAGEWKEFLAAVDVKDRWIDFVVT